MDELQSEIDLEEAHLDLFELFTKSTRNQMFQYAWAGMLCSYISYLVESLISTALWAVTAAIPYACVIYLFPTYRKAKRIAAETRTCIQRLENNQKAIDAFGNELRRYGQRWLDS